jgi:hypothetical protein
MPTYDNPSSGTSTLAARLFRDLRRRNQRRSARANAKRNAVDPTPDAVLAEAVPADENSGTTAR